MEGGGAQMEFSEVLDDVRKEQFKEAKRNGSPA